MRDVYPEIIIETVYKVIVTFVDGRVYQGIYDSKKMQRRIAWLFGGQDLIQNITLAEETTTKVVMVS